MAAIPQDINRVKIQKEFARLITMVLAIAGLPLLKNAIVAFLMKLYELLIQQAIER